MLSPEEIQRINLALANWRQGDVFLGKDLFFMHLADLAQPLTPAASKISQVRTSGSETLEIEGVSTTIPGIVVVSQTCDIVSSCEKRPYVEVSPLFSVEPNVLKEIQRLRRPAYAYIPALADRNLVADLDRTMTVEEAILAAWEPIKGWKTDDEGRAFTEALARKRARFAFPDDFVRACQKLQTRLKKEAERDLPEGVHLRAVREIRVCATPSWNSQKVHLLFWLVQDTELEEENWHQITKTWIALFDQSGRFEVDGMQVSRLEDMTAKDYTESDRLDLDQLSYNESGS